MSLSELTGSGALGSYDCYAMATESMEADCDDPTILHHSKDLMGGICDSVSWVEFVAWNSRDKNLT